MPENKNRLRKVAAHAAVLVGGGMGGEMLAGAATLTPNTPRWREQTHSGMTDGEQTTAVTATADGLAKDEAEVQPAAAEPALPGIEREKKWQSVAGLTIGKPPRAPKA